MYTLALQLNTRTVRLSGSRQFTWSPRRVNRHRTLLIGDTKTNPPTLLSVCVDVIRASINEIKIIEKYTYTPAYMSAYVPGGWEILMVFKSAKFQQSRKPCGHCVRIKRSEWLIELNHRPKDGQLKTDRKSFLRINKKMRGQHETFWRVFTGKVDRCYVCRCVVERIPRHHALYSFCSKYIVQYFSKFNLIWKCFICINFNAAKV